MLYSITSKYYVNTHCNNSMSDWPIGGGYTDCMSDALANSELSSILAIYR